MVMRIGDGTHHKKRHSQSQFHTKGATPIEKNVIVVDEQGNEYEATYPKRAKGLVKNGRARFVGENKICLACPPDTILEEEKMENNKLTVSDIFEQITLLQKELTENSQTSYIVSEMRFQHWKAKVWRLPVIRFPRSAMFSKRES